MLTCNNIHGIVSQVKSGQGFSGECVLVVGGSSPRLKTAILFVINLFAPEGVNQNKRGDTNMKSTILRIIVVTLLLVACGAAPVLADGWPVPLCYPNPCSRGK